MHLAIHEHLVQDRSAVVHRDVPDQARLARLHVDLGHRDVTAEGIALVALLEAGLGRQRRALRQLGPCQSRRGHALHAKPTVVEADYVLDARLQAPGRFFFGLVDQRDAGGPQRAATDLEGSRARRPTSARHQPGVALHHAHRIHRHIEQPRRQLRVCGLVSLAARGGADLEHDRTVRPSPGDPDLGGVEDRGHLHVRAQPDAQLHPVASVTTFALLQAQLFIASGVQRQVQRAFVVARVVGAEGRRRVRKLTPDQVAAAQLGGIDAQLSRKHVHRALDHRDRLWPAGSAIRGHHRGVGEDALRAELDLRDLVDARGQHRRQHELGGREPGVRSSVRDHMRLHTHERAV